LPPLEFRRERASRADRQPPDRGFNQDEIDAAIDVLATEGA